VFTTATATAGSPKLAQQVWDESLHSTRPLRYFLFKFIWSPYKCQTCQCLLCVPVFTAATATAGSPKLAQQVWDESLHSTRPLRHLLDETSSMFPACPGPFLQLATGLCQGSDSANAAYNYICSKGNLAVAYEAGAAGVLLQVSAAESAAACDVPCIPVLNRIRICVMWLLAKVTAMVSCLCIGSCQAVACAVIQEAMLPAWRVCYDHR
jgi:hypothetical protein